MLDEGMGRGVEGGCSTAKVTFGSSEHDNEQGEPEVETRKSSSALMGERGGAGGGGGGWRSYLIESVFFSCLFCRFRSRKPECLCLLIKHDSVPLPLHGEQNPRRSSAGPVRSGPGVFVMLG